jgi:uncharacterized protein YndB with AHSA1/START domain
MRTAAPVRFTNTVTIDRPQATVFAYLADLENLPRWNYAIQETRKITSGPVKVGSRYRQTRTVPVRSEESLEVTEYDPDRRLTVAGTLGAFPAQVTYVLDPVGSATRLTNTVDLTPPRPLRVLAPLATHRISAAVADNLEVLKQVLEQA